MLIIKNKLLTMNATRLHIVAAAVVALVLIFGSSVVLMNVLAVNEVVYEQGFEVDTSGWLDGDQLAGFGQIDRAVSGTGNITSFAGEYHAKLLGADSGPQSEFDGFRSDWPGDWQTEIAVYLDPTVIAPGEGFDYAVGLNAPNGDQIEDYIFHVAHDASTGALLIGTSNNTTFTVRSDIETLDHYEITSAGWYILQHRFYDDAGSLTVDMNVLTASRMAEFSVPYNTDVNVPDAVGGNRYGWFATLAVAEGLSVDDQKLIIPAPEPQGKADCQKGRWEQFGFKNQGACIQFLNNGKDSR